MPPSPSSPPSAHATPSSSSSQGGSSPGTHDESLVWTGILGPEQLSTLRSDFGSLILNPGVMAVFGNRTDHHNRIFIPAANKSYWQTRRKLYRWRDAAEHEQFSWWPAAMQENGITPLTANDIFNGLDVEKWLAYRKEYQRLTRAHARSQGKS